MNVTIGQYSKYSSEPFDRSKELRKKEQADEKKKLKGGPFKLCSHAKDCFDENPYRSKKPLPPEKEGKPSKDKPKPFKSSSPAKLIGGCMTGTFDPYPAHSADPYVAGKKPKEAAPSGGKMVGGIFRPSPGTKSMPTHSTMAQNVVKVMNSSNFLTVMQTSSP